RRGQPFMRPSGVLGPFGPQGAEGGHDSRCGRPRSPRPGGDVGVVTAQETAIGGADLLPLGASQHTQHGARLIGLHRVSFPSPGGTRRAQLRPSGRLKPWVRKRAPWRAGPSASPPTGGGRSRPTSSAGGAPPSFTGRP